MSDTIELVGIRAYGHHGVLPEERRDGQEFVVDALLSVDARSAAASDRLDDTVDYGSLAAAIAADVERDPVDLIETLAARIADTCLARPGVGAVTVRVHKPGAPIAVPFTDVVVTITRSR